MKNTIIYCIIILKVLNYGETGFKAKDVKLPLKTLVEKYGYPFEEHELITPDGYILKTHRIPYGKSGNTPNKKIVLIVHGLAGTSECFLLLGPQKALGFLLADQGYDVWLVNSRGNYYSRKHKYLNPDFQEYWHFSWDEMGLIDIPSNIDYILNVTQQKELDYIGHSQGCTLYFVMTSLKPEYNKKIRMSIHMAPPVFLNLNDNVIASVGSRHLQLIEKLAQGFNFVEIVSPSTHEWVTSVLKQEILLMAMEGFINAKETLISKKSFAFLTRTCPYGVSIYQFLHYFQVFGSGIFRRYDFGPKENLKRYNTTTPPTYDLSKSTAPVVLIHVMFDWFSSPTHAKYLSQQLPNLLEVYEVPRKEFNHYDFMYAGNAKELVYDYIINLLEHKNITRE